MHLSVVLSKLFGACMHLSQPTKMDILDVSIKGRADEAKKSLEYIHHFSSPPNKQKLPFL